MYKATASLETQLDVETPLEARKVSLVSYLASLPSYVFFFFKLLSESESPHFLALRLQGQVRHVQNVNMFDSCKCAARLEPYI